MTGSWLGILSSLKTIKMEPPPIVVRTKSSRLGDSLSFYYCMAGAIAVSTATFKAFDAAEDVAVGILPVGLITQLGSLQLILL